MTSPQQHCDHECVCHQAKSRPKNDCPIDFARAHGNKTCKCKHDTRSRPAPSPDKGCHWYKDGGCTKEDWLNEWERRAGPKQITLTSELPTTILPLPKGDTKDLKTWKEYWKQHDSVIAAQARNQTLNDVSMALGVENNSDHHKIIESLRTKEQAP